ncbi:Disease resistance protein (TIR-NBS-LRR class) [Quillaja saponaria]|uniref:Disease resistance protein (TIR-NBS-LRR class) n=1 Tax=Quillaja saponaria TaxID=32244 RepID=A0AAD7LPL0_QUISA|nr:Disease resistance protein (TIR-NBS-LRR class) [Quillaja saponaria]
MKQGWPADDLSEIFFPGAKISEWFIYKDEGPSVFFEAPHVIDGSMTGFTIGIVYLSCQDTMSSDYLTTTILIINHTKGTIQISKQVTQGAVISHEDQLWEGILSNIEGGDEVEIIVHFGHQFAVRKTAVYLAYSGPIDEEMIEYVAGPSNYWLDQQLENQGSSVAPTPSIELELIEDEQQLHNTQSCKTGCRLGDVWNFALILSWY